MTAVITPNMILTPNAPTPEDESGRVCASPQGYDASSKILRL